MIKIFPICHIKKDNKIPAKMARLSWFNGDYELSEFNLGKAIAIEYKTVKMAIQEYGAIINAGSPDLNALVLSIDPVTNVFCGGDCEYVVTYIRQESHRRDNRKTASFYFARDNGNLYVSIPC